MGFRTGSYAKVWDVTPVSDVRTKLRITTSKKNKQTGEYEQDFSGFVSVFGTASAADAAKLIKGDMIVLKDVDVTNRYDKEAKKEYTNFNVYTFERYVRGETNGAYSNNVDSNNVESAESAVREPVKKSGNKVPF